MTNEPFVSIMDPKILQSLFTTNNMYFDKHPLVADLTKRFFGNSTLLARTDQIWKKRRAAMSPAFYKGKLERMVELAKGCVQLTLSHWKELSESGKPT